MANLFGEGNPARKRQVNMSASDLPGTAAKRNRANTDVGNIFQGEDMAICKLAQYALNSRAYSSTRLSAWREPANTCGTSGRMAICRSWRATEFHIRPGIRKAGPGDFNSFAEHHAAGWDSLAAGKHFRFRGNG